MRVVLDTNVLVSGLISLGAAPGRIVDLVRSAALTLVVDDRILSEYADVLRRSYLRRYFTDTEARQVIEFLQHRSHLTVCRVIVTDLPDPADIPFLEAALSEDVPLVTGNKKHFPSAKRRGALVLSPREFLEKYSRETRSQDRGHS